MNFELNDEQKMLQDTLRRLLDGNHKLDGDKESSWSLLADHGLFAALFSEQHGGLGGSGFDLALIFEELGRTGSDDPVIDSALICGCILMDLAQDSHTELIHRVVAGDVQLAMAHSEPATRYELHRVETRADQHVLNGRKSGVFNAGNAEFLLVTARSPEETANRDGIALYLLPANTAGVTIHSYEVTGGGSAAEVILHNVRLTERELLSIDALNAIESANASAIVALCAQTLGAMETAVSMTCEYLNTRQQFGRPLAGFQALAHRVADLQIELAQARSAVILAAGYLDAETDMRDLHLSAAKNLLGRAGKLIAEETIQLHGGIGMTDEYRLGHFAKKIIMADHRFGDVDYHLERFIALSGKSQSPVEHE